MRTNGIGIPALAATLAIGCSPLYRSQRAPSPESRCQETTVANIITVGDRAYFIPGRITHCDLTGDGELDLVDIQHTIGDPSCQEGIYTRTLPAEFVQGCSLSAEEWDRLSITFGYKSKPVEEPRERTKGTNL